MQFENRPEELSGKRFFPYARTSSYARFSGAHILICVGIWLGWLSWLRPLTLPDEGRYAGVAWNMYSAGSPMVPLMNGMPYFHKPPLYYWLAEAGYFLFGVNEWSARLPSLLAAWAAVAAVYVFCRRYRDEKSARWAALVLATLPLFYGGAQFANMDMLVAGMISLATLSGASAILEHGLGRPYRRIMLACGAFAALAVLSKGLIGVVLPTLILLAWIAMTGRWKSLRVLVYPPAIAVFLLIGLPWFVLMQVRYPGFFNYFFIYQQFDRFAEAGFNNVQPFWFYVPILLGSALPWILFGRTTTRKYFWAPSPARDIRVLMVAWIVIVVGFFSLPSSKLVGYILPAIPPLALLLTDAVLATLATGSATKVRLVKASLSIAALICVMTVAIVTVATGHRGVKNLVDRYIGQVTADDTWVSLYSYNFDLPFYARSKNPTWVIDDWNDPKIGAHDNWRKELLDASLLAPDVGRSALILPDQFRQRMCASSNKSFWILGEPIDETIYYDALHGVAFLPGDAKHVLWHVTTDGAYKASHCEPAGN